MVIVVSHDQIFLNNICTDILELRSLLAGQKKTSLEHYTGDFMTYQQTLEERKITQQRARVAYEKEKEKLQVSVNRCMTININIINYILKFLYFYQLI